MSLGDEIENEVDAVKARQTIDRLSRRVAELKARNERGIEAAMQAGHDAVSSLPRRPTPKPTADRRRGKTAEAALWHLTDWQGAKVTPSYDSDVMHERVRRYIDKARKLTEIQRAAHPVREGIAVFGGDMIEGLFNFPTQPFEIDKTLFDQWAMVSDLIAEVVEAMLATYERVHVVSEWGNHGRIGSKRDCVPKNDNVDRQCYELARRMLRGYGDRLVWADCDEDIQRLEWQGYRALVIHGDEAGRNGFVSAQTMVSHVNRWKAGAYAINGKTWDFRDVYVGHYHRHAQEPLANGEGAVFWTGSTESDNRYAREQMAASARPSQRLHFIHPEGFVTAQYQVWVDRPA